MKAIYFNKHGKIDVVKYGEVSDPELKEGHIIVKVKACALNHLDIWVRRGWPSLKLKMPHITGSDIAGTVENSDCSEFKSGDKVIVFPGVNTYEDKWTKAGLGSVSPGYRIIGEHFKGGMAEYISVPKQNLIKVNSNKSYKELAAPNLVGLTSWRMLFTQGKLKKDETILIVGAGGGVNSISIQIANALGARVIALTSSESKCQKAKEIGAHNVINYKLKSNWHKEVLAITEGQGADIVIDNVGAKTLQKSIKAVSFGGRIVTVGNTSGEKIEIDNRMIFGKQISIIGSTMGSRKDFQEFTTFYSSHKLNPIIDQTFSLEKGIEAIKYLESGKQFGKVIITND